MNPITKLTIVCIAICACLYVAAAQFLGSTHRLRTSLDDNTVARGKQIETELRQEAKQENQRHQEKEAKNREWQERILRESYRQKTSQDAESIVAVASVASGGPVSTTEETVRPETERANDGRDTEYGLEEGKIRQLPDAVPSAQSQGDTRSVSNALIQTGSVDSMENLSSARRTEIPLTERLDAVEVWQNPEKVDIYETAFRQASVNSDPRPDQLARRPSLDGEAKNPSFDNAPPSSVPAVDVELQIPASCERSTDAVAPVSVQYRYESPTMRGSSMLEVDVLVAEFRRCRGGIFRFTHNPLGQLDATQMLKQMRLDELKYFLLQRSVPKAALKFPDTP